MADDSKTRDEMLSELRSLRARLQEVEQALQVASKERNNNAHRHAEEEVRWAKERANDRVSAAETLQHEQTEHRHSEEELGKAREQLRDVSFKLLQAEEAERKRIAQEIHDGVSQYWISVKYRVESILQQLGMGVAKPLEDLLPIIDLGIEETRRIQMNLRPRLLDSLGIVATINWVCHEFQKANPAIVIKTTINARESDMSSPLKTVIYRVMQEALNNVAQHSKAKRVNLTLQRERDTIKFIVQDDGQGFDLVSGYALKSDRGLGLAGMRERTILSGGSMSIDSIPGTGTTIRASWPV